MRFKEGDTTTVFGKEVKVLSVKEADTVYIVFLKTIDGHNIKVTITMDWIEGVDNDD
ncbi:MAG: hypothetical protein K9K32_07640 [Halanaerobiales bacterium]|nr:hypothetical protein [Halanaerobiales bacterium]